MPTCADVACCFRYVIPFNDLKCTKLSRSDANRITFENPASGNDQLATFCIDYLKV